MVACRSQLASTPTPLGAVPFLILQNYLARPGPWRSTRWLGGALREGGAVLARGGARCAEASVSSF